jgi:hypothetical protein
MIREFNEQCEKDYVRKTAETLEDQTVRSKREAEQNAQREDIDEVMGEGGGDEEEDGECEDGYENGHGSGSAAKRSGTQRRKLRSFYFRTGAVQVQQVPNDTDPLMWWKQHQQEFPDLTRMTRQYLTVPMIDLMWAKQAP